MILSKKNMEVVTSRWDEESGNHWYKIIVKLPQLHLETQDLNTTVYANELIDMIDKTDNICPHCKREI